MTALEEFQQRFQGFVLDGDFEILRSVEAGPRGRPRPRLAIYHDAYRIRLREALADTFGTLQAQLGSAAFVAVCARYVESAPSTVRNLRWYGESFADFLRATPPYDRSPWLAEIARFDWALAAAFDEADATPVALTHLTLLTPDQWPSTSFAFHPSVERLTLSSNAPMLRRAADCDQPLPEACVFETPVEWLVWRVDGDSRYRSLHEIEATLLDAGLAGATFTQLCALAGEQLGVLEAPTPVAQWLRQWVDDGLIVRLET